MRKFCLILALLLCGISPSLAQQKLNAPTDAEFEAMMNTVILNSLRAHADVISKATKERNKIAAYTAQVIELAMAGLKDEAIDVNIHSVSSVSELGMMYISLYTTAKQVEQRYASGRIPKSPEVAEEYEKFLKTKDEFMKIFAAALADFKTALEYSNAVRT